MFGETVLVLDLFHCKDGAEPERYNLDPEKTQPLATAGNLAMCEAKMFGAKYKKIEVEEYKVGLLPGNRYCVYGVFEYFAPKIKRRILELKEQLALKDNLILQLNNQITELKKIK